MNRVGSELQRVCREISDALGLCGATVTVMGATLDARSPLMTAERTDGEALAAASDDVSRAMSERQFDVGEGPSRDAFESGRLVLVNDLEHNDRRWPTWTPSARAAGVEGVYALPLSIGAARLGVFTCYLSSRHTGEGPPLNQLLLAADEITDLLLSLRSDGQGQLSDAEGQRDLHIRSEVYQAQGMLMVALGVSLPDALARLRAMAYAESIDLNDLAVDLIKGRRPFPED